MNKQAIIFMSAVFFLASVYWSYNLGMMHEREATQEREAQKIIVQEMNDEGVYLCDADHKISVSDDGTGIAVTLMYANGEYAKAFFAHTMKSVEGDRIEYTDGENTFVQEAGDARFAINDVDIITNCTQ